MRLRISKDLKVRNIAEYSLQIREDPNCGRKVELSNNKRSCNFGNSHEAGILSLRNLVMLNGVSAPSCLEWLEWHE
ncbi:MAG: hypothetical protein AAF202_13800 [Pseudomonadota bacterium]